MDNKNLQKNNLNFNQQSFQNQQSPNQNTINNQPPNLVTLNDYLNYSFRLSQEGYNLFQQSLYEKSLEKYDECEKYLRHVYPFTQDEPTKIRIEEFIKSISLEKNKLNYQIENKFQFRKEAGRANKVLEEQKNAELKSYLKSTINYVPETEKNYSLIVLNKNISSNYQINQSHNQKIPDSNNDQYSQPNVDKQRSSVKEDKIIPDDIKNKILGEILDNNPGVPFSDVIGLGNVKQILKEIIILPTIRPDLFTGLRSPPKGLLLFGPPGTGKTMIAKAVATECKCTFFSISASALTSKYVGESEKLVRALFDIANEKQPSVVFIDEIESILSKRSEGENDATKRLKTEFLIQFDGVGSNQDAKVLIIGATNRPFDLDTAVLRRMPKRVLIPAFNAEERFEYLKHIFKNNEHNIKDDEFIEIAKLTDNYSNSDLKELCREAAYEPIREITDLKELENLGKLRALKFNDLKNALRTVRGTLNENILTELNSWNKEYGALG